jgi:hypothetical protein
LIVREDKSLVTPDRPSECPAKLILVEGGAGGIEVSPRIEHCVAKELERVTVPFVGSTLGDSGDDATVVVAVLRVEIGG